MVNNLLNKVHLYYNIFDSTQPDDLRSYLARHCLAGEGSFLCGCLVSPERRAKLYIKDHRFLVCNCHGR